MASLWGFAAVAGILGISTAGTDVNTGKDITDEHNRNLPDHWLCGRDLPTRPSFLTLSTRSTTLCESSDNQSATTTDNDDDEDDPYANLPDEDEETSCAICKTFRKGPCRPFWRKLERCFKDHEDDGGPTKCMKYFVPHQDCLMKYSNLYHLVSLDTKQELVQEAEQATRPEEYRTWSHSHNSPVKVDWSIWKEFVADQGIGFRQTKAPSQKELPYWERLPIDTEPVLLTIPVEVPQFCQHDSMDKSSKTTEAGGDSRMILKVAYVVDQDGMVLGFVYNTYYQNLIEQATPIDATKAGETDDGTAQKTELTKSAEGEDVPSGPPPESFAFDFFILPGETKQIRICALYAENPVTASPEKDLLDVRLYQGSFYSLAAEAYSPKR